MQVAESLEAASKLLKANNRANTSSASLVLKGFQTQKAQQNPKPNPEPAFERHATLRVPDTASRSLSRAVGCVAHFSRLNLVVRRQGVDA